jgi:hypothetical protein
VPARALDQHGGCARGRAARAATPARLRCAPRLRGSAATGAGWLRLGAATAAPASRREASPPAPVRRRAAPARSPRELRAAPPAAVRAGASRAWRRAAAGAAPPPRARRSRAPRLPAPGRRDQARPDRARRPVQAASPRRGHRGAWRGGGRSAVAPASAAARPDDLRAPRPRAATPACEQQHGRRPELPVGCGACAGGGASGPPASRRPARRGEDGARRSPRRQRLQDRAQEVPPWP